MKLRVIIVRKPGIKPRPAQITSFVPSASRPITARNSALSHGHVRQQNRLQPKKLPKNLHNRLKNPHNRPKNLYNRPNQMNIYQTTTKQCKKTFPQTKTTPPRHKTTTPLQKMKTTKLSKTFPLWQTTKPFSPPTTSPIHQTHFHHRHNYRNLEEDPLNLSPHPIFLREKQHNRLWLQAKNRSPR